MQHFFSVLIFTFSFQTTVYLYHTEDRGNTIFMLCLAYIELSILSQLPSLLFQTTLACQTIRTSILLVK